MTIAEDQEVSAGTHGPLRLRLRTSIQLAKVNYKSSLESRGGEVDSVS